MTLGTLTRVVYANPLNVAPADQLAASFEPPAGVRLSPFIDARSLYVVSEDAIWNGLNLRDAAEFCGDCSFGQ